MKRVVINEGDSGETFKKSIDHKIQGAFMNGFLPSSKWFYSQKNMPGIFKLLILGDSLTANMNYYIHNAFSRTMVGLNSIGLTNFKVAVSELYTVTNTGTSIEYPSSADVHEFGVKGYVCKLTGAQIITYTQIASQPFNSFKILYRKMVGGGTFKYKVDSGSYVEVSTDNASDDLGILTVNNDYEGLTNHTITIEIVSGTCWMYGIKAYNQFYPGIQIDLVAVGGISAQATLANNFYINKYIDDVDPDQMHVWLGMNDKGSSRTPAQFKADIVSILAAITTLPAHADTCLYGYHETGNTGSLGTLNESDDAALRLYENEIIDLCQTADYSFFDVRQVMTTRAVGQSLSFWADEVHYSATGINYFVQKILAFILLPLLNNSNAPMFSPHYSQNVFLVKNGKLQFWRYASNGGIVEDQTYLTGSSNTIELFVAGASKMYNYATLSGVNQPFILKPYAKASLPAVNTMRDGLIVVYDEIGGRTPAYSDGTNWRRVADGAIVS